MGYADVENRVPCTEHTVMRIASVSKPIAMATVAKLWEEKKLDIDEPITKYVKDWPAKTFGNEKVSLKYTYPKPFVWSELLDYSDIVRRYFKFHSSFFCRNIKCCLCFVSISSYSTCAKNQLSDYRLKSQWDNLFHILVEFGIMIKIAERKRITKLSQKLQMRKIQKDHNQNTRIRKESKQRFEMKTYSKCINTECFNYIIWILKIWHYL